MSPHISPRSADRARPRLSRRVALSRLIALLALSAAPRLALAADENEIRAARELLERLRGGRAPVRTGIVLDLPPLAENGNSVPLHIKVESAMRGNDRVQAVHLIAEKNPRPSIATFAFGEGAGRAEVETHVRLAGTQRVFALAEMSDGTLRYAETAVAVTITACFDGS